MGTHLLKTDDDKIYLHTLHCYDVT